MKTVYKGLLGCVVVMLFCLNVNAQQQPEYSFFYHNFLGVNPAYAGVHNYVDVTVLGRVQWAGVENSPSTQSILFNSYVPGTNLGLGLNLTNDVSGGIIARTGEISMAYMIPMGYESGLSIGLNGGLAMLRSNTQFNTRDDASQDEAINRLNQGYNVPVFGAGLAFYHPVFTFGLSAPRISDVVNTDVVGDDAAGFDQQHVYFFAAGRIGNQGDFIVEPMTMLKWVYGLDMQYDLLVKMTWNESLWWHVGVRDFQNIPLGVGYTFADNYHIGYNYDVIVRDLVGYANGSHELMLKVDFGHSDRGYSSRSRGGRVRSKSKNRKYQW